jgi:hypothetical protein
LVGWLLVWSKIGRVDHSSFKVGKANGTHANQGGILAESLVPVDPRIPDQFASGSPFSHYSGAFSGSFAASAFEVQVLKCKRNFAVAVAVEAGDFWRVVHG